MNDIIIADNDNRLNWQKNSFDVLRWLAAFSVMYLHLTGYAKELQVGDAGTMISVLRKCTAYWPGVLVLFSISGFLASASLEKSSNPITYMKKRVMRMIPAYYTMTIINAVLLIVLAGALLQPLSLIKWGGAQLCFLGYTPAYLKSFATGSVNGVLWTIPVEIQFYILMALLNKKIKKMSDVQWLVTLVCLGVINMFWGQIKLLNLPSAVNEMLGRVCLPYALWFAIGVFCYEKRQKVIPILRKYIYVLIIVFIVLLNLIHTTTPGYYLPIYQGILIPFITIGLAFTLPAFRIKIDITYGMYLYHWLVLNVMIHNNMFASFSWTFNLCVFTVATLVIAFLSYQMIERRFLKK